MKKRNWQIAERMDPDLSKHLLQLRLQQSSIAPEQYLNPTLANLSSPQQFWGINDAVNRIKHAIEHHEEIVVWGDFDADGVTSTAIMWETLYSLGASVMPYIPNRDTEGHGFSPEGVNKLISNHTKLVITVDHGITAIEEVEALHQQGIDVIVTDHHTPLEDTSSTDQNHPYQLPDAVAVIHPQLMDNPQPLAGCGVSYMLAYAVWLKIKELPDNEESRTTFAQNVIELAAIGTIADMVPLSGDNRILAAYGLQSLAKTSRPGLQQMYQLANMQDKQAFGAYEVGFGIGPRLNAPGRLGDALESLRLLCTKDALRAGQLAQNLDNLNRQRQDLLTQVAEEAKAEALKHSDGVYVLAKANWPAGVCGLAAGKIVENYYRPAVVMEIMGDLSRGSARSIPGFDFTAALRSISHLLESFGGHAMAAGFVAKTSNLPKIEKQLSDLFWQQFKKENLMPILSIDAEAGFEELGWDIYKFITQLEPFGVGNPKPVFLTRGVQIVNFKAVGGEGKHLKLTLQSNTQQSGNTPTSLSFEGIAFGFGHLAEKLQPSQPIDIAYQLDENVWQNRRSLQLVVKDVQVELVK